MQSHEDPQLVSGSDAARLAGVSRQAIMAAANRGDLDFVPGRFGRLYPLTGVEAYARRARRRQHPTITEDP